MPVAKTEPIKPVSNDKSAEKLALMRKQLLERNERKRLAAELNKNTENKMIIEPKVADDKKIETNDIKKVIPPITTEDKSTPVKRPNDAPLPENRKLKLSKVADSSSPTNLTPTNSHTAEVATPAPKQIAPTPVPKLIKPIANIAATTPSNTFKPVNSSSVITDKTTESSKSNLNSNIAKSSTIPLVPATKTSTVPLVPANKTNDLTKAPLNTAAKVFVPNVTNKILPVVKAPVASPVLSKVPSVVVPAPTEKQHLIRRPTLTSTPVASTTDQNHSMSPINTNANIYDDATFSAALNFADVAIKNYQLEVKEKIDCPAISTNDAEIDIFIKNMESELVKYK